MLTGAFYAQAGTGQTCVPRSATTLFHPRFWAPLFCAPCASHLSQCALRLPRCL